MKDVSVGIKDIDFKACMLIEIQPKRIIIVNFG